ncbi:MAG: hypothetical protein ACKPKO_34490, partial [Candidatus Fonsibacter sp.]
VIAAAADGLGGGNVPRVDEDCQVLVVVTVFLVVWDSDTGITYSGTPTANCAAEPSVVDCVVVAIGAYGVSAPILCNKLPICEVAPTEGAVLY